MRSGVKENKSPVWFPLASKFGFRKCANHIPIFANMALVQRSKNRIGGVMISVLSSSAVDRGFEYYGVKPKTINLVFVAFSLSMHH